MDVNTSSVAILMVGWVGVAIMWLFLSHAEGANRRRGAMMARIGLHPDAVSLDSPHTVDLGVAVRHRCRGCTVDGYCERWLAGEVQGDNSFCPNAETFKAL